MNRFNKYNTVDQRLHIHTFTYMNKLIINVHNISSTYTYTTCSNNNNNKSNNHNKNNIII